jgi:hypothetical protein
VVEGGESGGQTGHRLPARAGARAFLQSLRAPFALDGLHGCLQALLLTWFAQEKLLAAKSSEQMFVDYSYVSPIVQTTKPRSIAGAVKTGVIMCLY